MSGASYWPALQADIRQHIVAGELARFPEWSAITATMFVGPGAVIDAECDEMLARDASRALVGPEFGNYPNSNLIHQAYHIFKWERSTGLRISQVASIVEIGGGYGALARVCRGLGFAGEYRVYDLPEMLDLQRHYFHETGTPGMGASAHSALGAERCDLLIALFSLSEMDLETQAPYLARIWCNHFLIGIHNAPWFGVDNHTPLDARFGHGKRVAHPHLDGRYYWIG